MLYIENDDILCVFRDVVARKLRTEEEDIQRTENLKEKNELITKIGG